MKQYLNDIIISTEVALVKAKTRDWTRNKVVMIAKNVDSKQAFSIVQTLKRVLPPKYYVATLGPGQYELGSTFHSVIQ